MGYKGWIHAMEGIDTVSPILIQIQMILYWHESFHSHPIHLIERSRMVYKLPHSMQFISPLSIWDFIPHILLQNPHYCSQFLPLLPFGHWSAHFHCSHIRLAFWPPVGASLPWPLSIAAILTLAKQSDASLVRVFLHWPFVFCLSLDPLPRCCSLAAIDPFPLAPACRLAPCPLAPACCLPSSLWHPPAASRHPPACFLPSSLQSSRAAARSKIKAVPRHKAINHPAVTLAPCPPSLG